MRVPIGPGYYRVPEAHYAREASQDAVWIENHHTKTFLTREAAEG